MSAGRTELLPLAVLYLLLIHFHTRQTIIAQRCILVHMKHAYLTYAGILAAGLVFGWLGATYVADQTSVGSGYIVREGGYEFINPLISCNIKDDQPYAGFSALQQNLRSAIANHIAAGDATRVSIYVRDMDQGQWTGVNYDQMYVPASLVKVPLLIALERASRDDTTLLTKKLTLIPSLTSKLVEHYPPPQHLEVGHEYTLADLMRAMIVYSDNDATQLIANTVSDKTLSDVYTNFDVVPLEDPAGHSVSPNNYMRFFRILYNASYLGRVRSQDSLKLLSQSTFKDGIVKGIPTERTVAHKFGERTEVGANGAITESLHDCGIVYYPHAPYGICIMTEGSDFTKLSSVIADLSGIVYSAVDGGIMSKDGTFAED